MRFHEKQTEQFERGHMMEAICIVQFRNAYLEGRTGNPLEASHIDLSLADKLGRGDTRPIDDRLISQAFSLFDESGSLQIVPSAQEQKALLCSCEAKMICRLLNEPAVDIVSILFPAVDSTSELHMHLLGLANHKREALLMRHVGAFLTQCPASLLPWLLLMVRGGAGIVSIKSLAARSGLSVRTIHRWFVREGVDGRQLVRLIRLFHASVLLEKGHDQIAAARSAGYSSPRAMRCAYRASLAGGKTTTFVSGTLLSSSLLGESIARVCTEPMARNRGERYQSR